MKTYFRIFVIVLSFCVSKPVFALENSNQESSKKAEYINKREKVIKDIQGVLSLDKSKVEYSKELELVKNFPEFNKNSIRDYSKDYHHYVKALLPYLLKKVKNNDVNGEFTNFHQLLVNASEIDDVIQLSNIEKVSFDLCLENLRTEKILRACSHAISKYENKKLQMDVELNRFNGLAPHNLNKASAMANDYSDLRRSVASSIKE